jgi:hypothetical protein
MVVWVLTAGIGIYLLVTGIAAQRIVAAQRTVAAQRAGGGTATAATAPAAEGSPLLEFMHPMLALLGLTFWIFFVMTGDRLFAWIAFGVVVATVLAGLGWVIIGRVAARRRGRGAGSGALSGEAAFPAHLVAIHGLAAACTFALVVIAAATAAHS